ncbi:MAG: hypothetical protein RL339_1601 [Pseudomonadota bacterium]
MRPLPELTAENTAFWTGGERGELMIAFCSDCDKAIHPPQLLCPTCQSQAVVTRAVAGTGAVYSFTVNHQPWLPDMAVPFAIAVVDVDDAPGVRVTAPVACDDPDSVQIGQRMVIGFEPSGDVWLPLWSPLEGAAG